MARRVIGLDLGAYSVKLVRLVSGGKQTSRFEIADAVEEILPIAQGADDNLIERQKEALAKFSEKGLLEGEVFAIGLEAISGQMRGMQVPFLDNRKLEAVLPGLLDAEVPFEMDDMIVSWHRQKESLENVGQAKPAFANINVAFGKKAAIAKILPMLQSFSVNPRLMLLSSAAPFELVRELKTDALFNQSPTPSGPASLSAIIDFGHQATNVCIFDQQGLSFSRSFLRGGKKLTEEIAKALNISFQEAQDIKHEVVNVINYDRDQDKTVYQLAKFHHEQLLDDIVRTFISTKTSGRGEIQRVTFIGGGSKARGLKELFSERLKEQQIDFIPIESLVPIKVASPSMVLPFCYALACMQIHAKESRFNFRKDEFGWRGDLDFLRANSTPLILWGLVLICSLTVMWATSLMVLKKENLHIENELKNVCASILGQKNVAPQKCLAQMKEQISANIDVGIPEFSASDIYVHAAELLPKEVIISELDILGNKVKIRAKTTNFEEVDKAVASISKIPCFVKVEKGRAQQIDGGVEFNVSSDVDCAAAREKNKEKSRG